MCEFSWKLFPNLFYFVKFSSVPHRERSLAKIYHVKLIYTQLPSRLATMIQAAQVSPTLCSNHSGAQNARRRRSRLVVMATVMMVKTGVVTAVATMMVMVRHGRRLLSGVGGGHRSSLLRRRRHRK